MPSKSKKQERLMAAAARDPRFAKRVGITMGIAKEFNDADMAKIMKTHKKRGMLGV